MPTPHGLASDATITRDGEDGGFAGGPVHATRPSSPALPTEVTRVDRIHPR